MHPRQIIKEYKECWGDHGYIASFFFSLFLLASCAVVSFYAITFATTNASSGVTDIILSNIRAYDVDWLFVAGSIILCVLVALLCFVHPRRLPFILKSISIFVFIRSAFITLTHIGPFPGHITIDLSTQMDIQKYIGKNAFFTLFSGNDFFFSGQTGIAFLIALMYWKNAWMRIGFIILSVAFGVIALLGHLHYTIDIVSAFFITYTIYYIARVFFRADYAAMNESAVIVEE